MRIFSTISALLFGISVAAAPLDFIQIPSDPAMQLSLNGQWAFKFVGGSDWSAYSDFYKNGYNASSWDKIAVPSCWDNLGILKPEPYHPEDVNGLLKTSFNLPSAWKDKKIFINFDGVLRGYELWVNGSRVGCWESANNSSQFELTPYIKSGTNDISLRVYTRFKGYEFDGNDDWGQVGVHRDITLFAVPSVHVKDITIVSAVPEKASPEVTFSFVIGPDEARVAPGTALKGTIRHPDGTVCKTFDIKVNDKNKRALDYRWVAPDALLWTAETPALYKLELSLCTKGKQQEIISRRFGIRQVRIDGDKFLLNNRLFKMRGVALHATDPENGKTISRELMLKDMKMMKEANVNFIRTSHYPKEPLFYDLCDSLGFYVVDEVPFGYGDRHLKDSTYLSLLILRAEATVHRDKNHPCVMVWSVGNENQLTEICQTTGKRVQQLDPTRPICYPMIGGYFRRFKFNFPDFVDIMSPHYPSAKILEEYSQKTKRPILTTEYSHSLGQSLEDHHERWEAIQKYDNITGGAVWHWVDQGMPDPSAVWPGKYAWTDKVWLSESKAIQTNGNKFTDGILYPTRDPLSNYWNVRKNYAQAYILSEKPVLKNGAYNVEIENRYDFVNLKDRLNCVWKFEIPGEKTIAEGRFEPNCAPHAKCTVSINASEVKNLLKSNICLLTLEFTDKTNGLRVNEKSFVLNSEADYSTILSFLKEDSEGPLPINGDPLWRTGRKPTLAEEMQYAKGQAKQIVKYILSGKSSEGKTVFANSEISYDGKLEIRDKGIGREYSFAFKTDKVEQYIPEAGLALLLDEKINCFQWIGRGPYSSYPGKDNANEPGTYALKTGDLYFEGNKRGVDALLCTDEAGDGVLFLSNVKDVNFEQTDKGVLLSFDPVVSGYGPKNSLTVHKNYSDKMGTLSGKVLAVPVKGGKWNNDLKKYFKNPSSINCYSPFLSQYDTYLRKLEDIMEQQ